MGEGSPRECPGGIILIALGRVILIVDRDPELCEKQKAS